VGGVMGVQAVRIGCGSTRAAAQDALLVLDLNADGARSAGDGRIDLANSSGRICRCELNRDFVSPECQ
jgi:hypothetical protein